MKTTILIILLSILAFAVIARAQCVSDDDCSQLNDCDEGPIAVVLRGVCVEGQCDQVPGDICQSIGCRRPICIDSTSCGTVQDDSLCQGEDLCSIGTCETSGTCTFAPTCPDDPSTPCLVATCDPATGQCGTAPNECDDGNACTTNECVSNLGGCLFNPVDCDDTDPCTVNSCDPAVGCVTDPTCDDNNACTVDSCSTSFPELCRYEPVDCDDGNPCTVNTCNPALGCQSEPVVCDDGNACTTNECVPTLGGCLFNPIDCDDADPCTINTCNPATGCVTQPTCDDNDVCTIDSCSTSFPELCRYESVDCGDGDACTVNTCDPVLGCQSAPVNCDDNNQCTVDSCDSELGCQYQPVDCDDNNKCTVDSCDSELGCQYQPVDCDDNNKCTIDSCDSASGCTYEAVDCSDNNYCTAESCDSASGCIYPPAECRECTERYCYWRETENHLACDKVLTEGQLPTEFCGKNETQILQEEVDGLYANVYLAKQYFVALNNMNCRNNGYSEEHFALMAEAAELLSKVCRPVGPSDPLFGKLVALTAKIMVYTRRSQCKTARVYSCDAGWKSNGKKELTGFMKGQDDLFKAAGYELNNDGYYVVEGKVPTRNSDNGIRDSMISLGVITGLIVVGAVSMYVYHRRRRLRFVNNGGTVI